MPTYCVPWFSGVPGSGATDLEWWTGTPPTPATPPNTTHLKYFPDDPDWLGALGLSEGDGATRHLEFRALQGMNGTQQNLYLSWIARLSSLDTTIDRVNMVLGDGTNYIAIRARLESAAESIALKSNITNAPLSFRTLSCSVVSGVITTGGQIAEPTEVVGTGSMWVDTTMPGRSLPIRWAFQVAIPLGTVLAPSAVSLPTSDMFKLWYEVWISIAGRTTPYQVPTTPLSIRTTSALQIAPPGLTPSHMLDVSSGGSGCTEGVRIEWGSTGVRNVFPTDPPRPDTTTIRLDLGQPYPPNIGATSPYNTTTHVPNVSDSRYRNDIYTHPILPTGFTNQADLRARFSLANWGSQYSVPTASSWRPTPGGEDVHWDAAEGGMHFIWPLPSPTTADSYTTNLARNINAYLNAVATGGALTGQHPHQCMLVEISSINPSVLITKRSVYENMQIASASVFEDLAQISVVGLMPISTRPRDVYLYIQRFNMPKVVTEQEIPGTDNLSGIAVSHGPNRKQVVNVDDAAAMYPTYVIHAFHETGEEYELEDGRRIPILERQTSFGYFVSHEGDLYGWETRLYGAEKVPGYDDFYVKRVPNNGASYVMVAIQARESINDEPIPETRELPPQAKPDGCLAMLESLGPIGKAIAAVLRGIFGGG